MNYLKKMGISIGMWFLITMILSFINTVFNYFEVYNYSFYIVISFIIIIISSLISGFINGKSSNKNGWLEGLKIGLIIVFISLIVNLLGGFIFNVKTIVFYLIVLGVTTLGSMFGIQRKST